MIWAAEAYVSADFLLVNCSFECIISLVREKEKRMIIDRTKQFFSEVGEQEKCWAILIA